MSYSVTISGHAPTVEAERAFHAQLDILMSWGTNEYGVSQYTFIGSVVNERGEISDDKDRVIAELRDEVAVLRDMVADRESTP